MCAAGVRLCSHHYYIYSVVLFAPQRPACDHLQAPRKWFWWCGQAITRRLNLFIHAWRLTAAATMKTMGSLHVSHNPPHQTCSRAHIPSQHARPVYQDTHTHITARETLYFVCSRVFCIIYYSTLFRRCWAMYKRLMRFSDEWCAAIVYSFAPHKLYIKLIVFGCGEWMCAGHIPCVRCVWFCTRRAPLQHTGYIGVCEYIRYAYSYAGNCISKELRTYWYT